MNSMEINELVGTTTIDLDERLALIPKHIETQEELNEWEQANILTAKLWLSKHKLALTDFATIEFCKLLHKKMFNKTWKWAGQFRKTNKNIGIDWFRISISLKDLFADVLSQIQHDSYPIVAIAARFHHRLVYVHPFSNGNGRHARLATDCLMLILKQNLFNWGARELTTPNEIRKIYIKALQKADLGDYQELIRFIKS